MKGNRSQLGGAGGGDMELARELITRPSARRSSHLFLNLPLRSISLHASIYLAGSHLRPATPLAPKK
jgi:hypothetical protein